MIDHIRTYQNHARALGVSFKDCRWIHQVVDALLQGDIYLNSIPLWQWDSYHGYYVIRGKCLNPSWSISMSVCTAKIAATISALIILGYPVETPEQISEALEHFQQKQESVHEQP